MFLTGFQQAGSCPFSTKNSAPCPPVAHAQSPSVLCAQHVQRRGRPLATVAAQRRPVDRNLLDNVDVTVPDGYSNYGPPTYPWSGGEQLQTGTWAPDTPADGTSTTQAAAPTPVTWADAGTSPDDWPQGPQTVPTPIPQPPETQPVDVLGAGPDPHGSSPYDGNGYRYPDPEGPLNQGAVDPRLQSARGPSSAAAAAGSAAGSAPAPSPPLAQDPGNVPMEAAGAHSQHPGQEARPFVGSDWGEVDPLTDWGGLPYGDSSGWDELDGSGGARPPASDTAVPSGSVGGGGPAANGWRTEPYTDGTAPSGAARADPDGGDATGWFANGPSASSGGSPPPPNSSYGSWPGASFTQDERFGAGPSAAGAASSSGRRSSAADALRPSDIVLLSGRDASTILPLAPMSTQVDFFQPKTLQERIVQFVGSIGASVVLSKAAVLAGPALLYPVWSPWIRAGLRNVDLYSKAFASVGLWRAEVLDVQINGLAIGGVLLSKQPPVVAMLLGDPWPGGARVSLELPYQLRSENIRVGDAVELLVLSRDSRFTSFKVVREVYLPQTGLWLYDYPYVNRDLFVAVSVSVERQRRAEAAAAAEAQWFTYDVPASPGMGPQGPQAPGPGPADDGRASGQGYEAGTYAAQRAAPGLGPQMQADMGMAAGPSMVAGAPTEADGGAEMAFGPGPGLGPGAGPELGGAAGEGWRSGRSGAASGSAERSGSPQPFPGGGGGGGGGAASGTATGDWYGER